MRQKTILALDLGTRHVGVALSGSGGTISSLEDFQYKDLFELERRLKTLIKDYDIELLLVGDMGQERLPQNLDQVVRKLTDQNHLKLKIVPERFTSFQARSHSQAALNILRDFLGRC